MPYERQDNRRLRDQPWIAALFATIAGLFIYSIWIAPHDKVLGTQSSSIITPAENAH
jgi:hypothetical protein